MTIRKLLDLHSELALPYQFLRGWRSERKGFFGTQKDGVKALRDYERDKGILWVLTGALLFAELTVVLISPDRTIVLTRSVLLTVIYAALMSTMIPLYLGSRKSLKQLAADLTVFATELGRGPNLLSEDEEWILSASLGQIFDETHTQLRRMTSVVTNVLPSVAQRSGKNVDFHNQRMKRLHAAACKFIRIPELSDYADRAKVTASMR